MLSYMNVHISSYCTGHTGYQMGNFTLERDYTCGGLKVSVGEAVADYISLQLYISTYAILYVMD